MHYRLRTVIAATTLLVSLTSPLLPPSCFEPLAVRAQTTQDRKAQSDRLFQTGVEQFRKGQLRQALETYQRVLEIRRELHDRSGEAETLNQLGEDYRNLGQFETALKHHEQALAIMQELGNRAGVGATLDNIASVYENQGQYSSALKFYEQALAIRREVKDRAGEGATLNGLGNTYQDLKQYQDALKSYEQALVILREIGNSPNSDSYASRLGEGWSLNGLGSTYNALGKEQDALKFYEQALAIMREVGSRVGEGAVLLNTGIAYEYYVDHLRQNRLRSFDFYEQALAILHEIGHRPLEGLTLMNMGVEYEIDGKPETALESYKQALAIVQEVGHRPWEAEVLRRIGFVYEKLGHPQTAQEYYQQAQAIGRELGNRTQEEAGTWKGALLSDDGRIRNRLSLLTRLEGEGVIHYKNGEAHARHKRYQAALESYQQALIIVRQQGNRPWEWEILNEMGSIYEKLGQLKAALQAYEQGLAIRREVEERAKQEPIPHTIRVAEGTPVTIYYGGIEPKEAITTGIRVGEGAPITTPIVLRVEEQLLGFNPEKEEATLTNIGNVNKALGQNQAALKSYQQALAIDREETMGHYDEQGETIFKSMGSVYETLGQYQDALKSYQQALALGRGPEEEKPILLTNIGKAYEKLGQYQAALDSYQQALAIARRDRETYRFKEEASHRTGEVYEKPDEETILNGIGIVYEKLGQPQPAQEYRQQALAIRREMGNPTEEKASIENGKAILLTNGKDETTVFLNRLEGEGAVLFLKGHTYSEQEQYQAALESYQQALAIVRQQRNRPWEGAILNEMGSVYEKLGHNQAALESYKQALVITQEIERRGGEGEKATLLSFGIGGQTIRLESGQVTTVRGALWTQPRELILTEMGNVYKALGQNQAALESYQQALAIINREQGNRYQQEQTILLIASVYDNLQYQSALEAYKQLLASQTNDRSGQGWTLNSIGTVYKNQGQYQAALESYQKALAIAREQKQPDREGAILNNIGTVYENLGQYQAALESYKQALPIVSDLSWRETTLINIGSVSEKMGQHQAALASYEQALAIVREVKDRSLEGVTLINVGKVYDNSGQPQAALKPYQQALAILREVGNRAGEGQALNNIGEAYYHLGQHQTALEYYQQALAIRQEVGDKAGKGVTLKNIASTLEAQKQPELAIIFYKQSVNVTEAIRQDIRGLPQAQQQSYTETVADTYRRLADLLLQQNRVLEAQRVLDLLKIQELEDYLRDVRGSDNSSTGVAERPQEQQFREGTEAIINKAIAQGKELTQLESLPVSNRTETQKQRILELRKTEQEITKQFNAFLDSPKVREWIAQLQQTTEGQTFNLEAYGTALQDNLKKLQQDAVILYPLVLPDRLELVLVTPYAPPLHRTVPVKREELNRAIAEFRSALQNPTSDATIPARKLYDWLVKPLENDLAQAKTKTIIYAPDGQLRYIPLAALHDGKQWLVQRFRINNITAVTLTNLNTQPQSQLHVLAAAFTQGSYSFKVGTQQFDFSGLPFAGREVDSLAQTVSGTTKILNQQFTKDIALQMNDYSVVHLATHAAFVVGQPEESFILFGNGDRATLRDVKNWRLPNVDLVVLSACETGLGDKLGDGREILGFGYQMQQTSAKAAIASLWSVSDGGTQALMNAFYGALQTGKMTKAEALQKAQIVLITGDYAALGEQRGLVVQQRIKDSLPPQVSDRLSHPYYWAPFILIGNGL